MKSEREHTFSERLDYGQLIKTSSDKFIRNALLTLSIRSSSGFPLLIYQCPDAPDSLSERFGQSVRRPRTDCPKPPDTWCERQITTILQPT